MNDPTLRRVVQAIVPALWLLPAMAAAHSAHGAIAESATALEGTWCQQDANEGETIVQYSAAGLDVSAFTVLSEADPRRIGQQSSMRLTMESPNVFIRRDFAGTSQVFSVDRERLTVDSLLIRSRDPHQEVRQIVTTQSYYRCDVRKALQRAQAFLSSPRAEEAARKAFQRDAERRAAIEEQEREDAAMNARRNADREAYYADLLQQLNQVRRSPGS